MVTFCAFIVLLCIGQIECKSRDNGECAAICGKAEEMKRPEEIMEELNGKKVDNTVRIINGYDAKPRGWMVMIRLNSLTDKENYETCGGALISKRHVLTAGHCVCFDNPNSNIDCKAGTLKYDPTKVITCYIGINSRKTSEALSSENIGMYEFGVEKVIKHEGWDGSGLTFPDLALIKLSKTVTFNPDLDLSPIVPICLPTIDVQLSDKIGYVAGWGKTRNDDCFTDNFGPERHAKCRSKFYYNGNLFNGCIRIATPSEGNIRCQQFKKQLGQSAMPKIGESIMILYNKGKQSTICYNEVPPELGWCGTCLKNAEPFTYGYCPPDGNTIETDELITRVKRAQHWGFCSKLCQGNDTVPKSLQETGVTILKEKECEIFNSSTLMYRPPNELCAGFKIPYPKMKVYIRKLKRQTDKNTKPSYTFKYVSEQKNPLGAKEEHSKLDFYLGFSDSCQGDSGGPLYRFVDGRAYVVGVVSRGDDCAGFNQPGIYTNVKHYLDWIQKHIKDGGC